MSEQRVSDNMPERIFVRTVNGFHRIMGYGGLLTKFNPTVDTEYIRHDLLELKSRRERDVEWQHKRKKLIEHIEERIAFYEAKEDDMGIIVEIALRDIQLYALELPEPPKEKGASS